MNKLIEKIKILGRKRDTPYNNAEDHQNPNKRKHIREKIILKVFRANVAMHQERPSFDSFEIPLKRWTTVLDALIYAKSYIDSSIGIRYSCRMASCGSCGMKINGIPRLACYTNISELEGDTVTCEPLPNFPHIRDLVTDFSQFFNHHKEMSPYIHNEKADIEATANQEIQEHTLSEFKQTPEDVEKYLQFSYCIRCGLCYSACPTVATDTKFPGPQALSQAYRYYADTRDNGDKQRMNSIDNRHGIWRCHFAGSCSQVCPKGVDPALGIQLLRGHLMNFSKNEKKVAELRAR
ncbi:MAG: succinate dehydrogenase/fumarate reductase iron-sulfur subunit [Nitrososphaeraceae archaeon]|jgi:succinate dehydrogenase / fumarate reductase, iron-sulfur subunit